VYRIGSRRKPDPTAQVGPSDDWDLAVRRPGKSLSTVEFHRASARRSQVRWVRVRCPAGQRSRGIPQLCSSAVRSPWALRSVALRNGLTPTT